MKKIKMPKSNPWALNSRKIKLDCLEIRLKINLIYKNQFFYLMKSKLTIDLKYETEM